MLSGSENVNAPGITYRIVTLVLRLALVVGLIAAGWLVYQKLPAEATAGTEKRGSEATIQLVLQPPPEMAGVPLDISVAFYPLDVIAARHEYFVERRAGKRFDDFLTERMNGRSPVVTRLDPQGQAAVVLPRGTWWVHALLAGDQDLEWQLRVDVAAPKQTVVLTPQNAYTRTKSF